MMKNNSALFFTCSLIEYIGRAQRLRRADVVRTLGAETVTRIYRYADVLHCEPIAKIADEFTQQCSVPFGDFDNVSACRYEVPDYWTIGEVYERLIEDACGEDVGEGDAAAITAVLVQVYDSWISDAISHYNSDFFYQPRDYIYECWKAGEVLQDAG